MEATVGFLAARLQGELLGDPNHVIQDAQALRKAESHCISFLGDDTRIRELESTQAGAIIVGKKKLSEIPEAQRANFNFIVVPDAMESFITVLKQFRPERTRPTVGLSHRAIIAPTAQVGANTNIYPGASIGEHVSIGSNCDIHPGVVISDGVVIGNDVTIFPNAVLYPDVVVGNRVIIHASAVIGADGFGYRFKGGRFHKIPQLGSVRINDDVEIGACATIDRGMIGPTVIGEGTKIDNLVQVAHNCEIGKHNVFASQVGFSGSATTGDFVRIAGQVGIANQVHLGEGCSLGAKSGVHRDIPAGETHVGYPARPHDEAFKIVMAEQKLPEMRVKLRELERQVAKLTAALSSQTQQAEAA